MRSVLVLALGVTLVLGCNDASTAPPGRGDDDGSRLATRFESLADSMDAGGYSPSAQALRHAAEIVRLTGHATPVNLTVDGNDRRFLAVAEQLDFPNLVCTWPDSGIAPPDSGGGPPPDSTAMPPRPPPDTVPAPGDSSGVVMPDTVHVPVDSGVLPPGPPEPPECRVESTYSMRTLIAWEPERMAEVVRLVAYIGSGEVQPGVPDIMTGLPDGIVGTASPSTPPDSGSGSGGDPGGFPGFMGEYLVRDVGSWWAVAGDQNNDLLGSSGDCTADRVTFDYAEFECSAARFRFRFSMEVDPLRYEPLTGVADPPGGPEGRHTISMAASEMDGVRLGWQSWTPPPMPPDTVLVDSPPILSPAIP